MYEVEWRGGGWRARNMRLPQWESSTRLTRWPGGRGGGGTARGKISITQPSEGGKAVSDTRTRAHGPQEGQNRWLPQLGLYGTVV
ncbi:hypothetical protein J6590_058338 [Homalodisca vitripennis]|nr:hypothetical protein J6590_058338 [Homalodisca vitripennis]